MNWRARDQRFTNELWESCGVVDAQGVKQQSFPPPRGSRRIRAGKFRPAMQG